jgi:cell division protein FtsB
MDEFRKKKKFRQLLFSNISFLLLLIVFGFAVRGTWHMYSKEQAASAARVESEKQLAALYARKNFLVSEVGELRTEGGVEREIREKFSVVKPGEKVVVIVDSTTTPEEMPVEKTWWDKVRGWF